MISSRHSSYTMLITSVLQVLLQSNDSMKLVSRTQKHQTNLSCFCHSQSATSLKLDVLSCSTTSMLCIVSRMSAFSFSSRTWAPTSTWLGSEPASDTLTEVYDSSWLLSWRRKPDRSCRRIASSQFSVKRIISARHRICRHYTSIALVESIICH